LARRDMQAVHGALADARFAVLGYGSLGGEELGFGSDLDLVFVYAADAAAQSDGARPLVAARWCARLAQKIVALLGTATAAGRLFDVDVRLRPDGAKGLLVSPLSGFADYQRERAWTWEHQALVRARCVAGDTALCGQFERVRDAVLSQPRDAGKLRADVVAMRARMRAELDRSDAARLDPKQGAGGLVDLAFLLHYLVLRDAPAQPRLRVARDTPGLLAALCDAGALSADACTQLRDAHALLLDAGLRCTLDRRPRIVAPNADIIAACDAIADACRDNGLAFAGPSAA
jgi:glutamate-ammonia-ligase adenylyltransferase